jgi:hypothetical protein
MKTIPRAEGYPPLFQVIILVIVIPRKMGGAAMDTIRIMMDGKFGMVTVSMA